MGKKKAKLEKEASKKQKLNVEKMEPEEKEKYVGLPNRDLKKNLGCG
ncbi:MAG: hypothetical protein KF860_01845 [Cyclobacteriaceae bacterium]|nr:hypothetical protein [Cyclobacteriaceae bacterium]